MSRKTNFVAVRLSDEQRAALAAAAEEERRAPAVLTRLVLTDWLESQGFLLNGKEDNAPKT